MSEFEKRQLKYGIGLTGSIACGKSTIGRLLKEEGFLVIDADQISRKAVEPGSEALQQIQQYFGKDFLLEDGNLNRQKMREHIFQHKDAKAKLESFIHPHIAQLYKETVENSQLKFPFWFYEASLLIELNRQKSFFKIWVADCPHEIQVKRLMKRDSIDSELAEKMIQSQMSSEEKKKHASLVVDTNKSLEDLKLEIEMLSKILKKEISRG